jgi:hypothetical protein
MMSGPPCSRAFLGAGSATEHDAYWIEIVFDEDREGYTVTYKYDGGELAEFAHPRRDGCD